MIQSLFPSQKNLIDQWQNVAALGVVSYTVYLYFIDNITPCHGLLTTYFVLDFAFAKPEARIHHTLSLMVLSCSPYYGYNQDEANTVLRPFVKTEISTIFLIFKVVYEKNASDEIAQNPIAKTLHKINDLLFLATFVKTRLCDLLFDAMLNPEIHQNNEKYLQDSIIRNLHFYVGFFGLYALNLYWTSIIFRKLFKDYVVKPFLFENPLPSEGGVSSAKSDCATRILEQRCKQRFAWINTMANAERVLPWTLFLCFVPLLRNIHSNINTLYDFAGATVLAIASYIYHGRKRDILNSGKSVLIANNIYVNGLKDADNDVSTEFLFNVGAIHLKSFLSLIAIGSDRGWTSFMFHFACFLGSDIYSDQQTQITYTDEPNRHMKILFAFTMVPTMYDLVYIIAAVDDRVTQTQIFMTVLALAAIIKVKPLYNLNQILVHLLVVLHAWSIASAINSN